MKIAVIGATGTAGSRTLPQARHAGYETVALSRATGVDLHTGEGLVEGLKGSAVAIDTSNAFPTDPNTDLIEALTGATRNVARACAQAGVEHLVFLSICNIDDPIFDQFPYYLAKREQERIVRESGLSATIVRSAQWHEFATNPAAVTFHQDRVDVEDWLIQPIAASTVAEVLVTAAAERPASRQIAGPERVRLPDLTTAYLTAQADTRTVRTIPPSFPALADGVLLAPDDAALLGPTTEEWIKQIGS